MEGDGARPGASPEARLSPPPPGAPAVCPRAGLILPWRGTRGREGVVDLELAALRLRCTAPASSASSACTADVALSADVAPAASGGTGPSSPCMLSALAMLAPASSEPPTPRPVPVLATEPARAGVPVACPSPAPPPPPPPLSSSPAARLEGRWRIGKMGEGVLGKSSCKRIQQNQAERHYRNRQWVAIAVLLELEWR